jgi:chromatin structure-remodeling complex protein RSC7
MPDAQSEAESQQNDDVDAEGEEEEEEEEDDAEEVATSGAASPAVDETPTLPARRRPGRPPKRPQSLDASRTPSETPKRRGGFRGGSAWRGGRWKNRGGLTHVTQVPLDKDGNMANVVDDEVELPEDPEGEKKVDKNGYLKGGREYRVRTFTVADKGERLYMLSTEPARCIGFRDSYLFFQKHRQLLKIVLSEEAKRDLIERELIPHSYKGRHIGVVTARSVYREFGAKIIIGGKKIIDDYQVEAAKAAGDVEGEIAVPDDILPAPGEEYDRNRYVAWHGASAVYHSGMPTVPLPMGQQGAGVKKRKVHVTGSNWMLEHARAAR